MTAPALLDATDLLAAPHLTGVQRAERELLRHWPGPAPLLPCRIVPGTTYAEVFDEELAAGVVAEATAADPQAARRALAPRLAAGRIVDLATDALLLNIEPFFAPERAEWHRRVAGLPGVASHWLVHDFLPWLQPWFFVQGASRGCAAYLRALRAIPHVAFVSAQTRREYRERFMRGRVADGPVIAPGADALGLARQSFSPARRDVLLLGSVEPRKNTLPALLAFRELWREGETARLYVVGHAWSRNGEAQELLAELTDEPRLVHMPDASDAELRAIFGRIRGLLFPSLGEGYGLPPTEALAAGIPVIVANTLPSTAALPPAGQIRLEQTDAPAIAGALRRLLDDAEAERLWAEAATLSLPGWSDFARGCADWVLR